MLKILGSLFALLAVIYLGLCAALYIFQRSFIYYPQPGSAPPAADILRLPRADATVLVSARQRDGTNALLYFGGNAEDVSQNLPAFSQAFPDYAIYLLHYRGYGGSSGTPSEEAIQSDALALFDMVYANHKNIAVIGRSLGSGVAIHLASQRPAARLVLVTPYNSMQELAAAQFPYFPVSSLLKDKFESWRYAPQIKIPTLLIAAENDEVIPGSSTKQLSAHFAAGIATLRTIPATGHNTISADPAYLGILRAALYSNGRVLE